MTYAKAIKEIVNMLDYWLSLMSDYCILQMYKIDTLVKQMVEYNNSVSDLYNYNWTSICIP